MSGWCVGLGEPQAPCKAYKNTIGSLSNVGSPELKMCAFAVYIPSQKKGEPFIGSLTLPLLYLTWSQNMTVVWSLEQKMMHLLMPLKALPSMFFYFCFLKTTLSQFFSVPKGELHLPLIQEADPLVPLSPEIVRFRGRLWCASSTSGGKIRKYAVRPLPMCDSFWSWRPVQIMDGQLMPIDWRFPWWIG